VNFTDTTHTIFGKSLVRWDFGDASSTTGLNVTHNYNTTGTYTIQQIVFGLSGCSDTISRAISVTVKNRPVTAIVSDTVACSGQPLLLTASVQSIDPVNFIKWSVSNGVTGTNNQLTAYFILPGIYTVQLVSGTVNGCYDTVVKTIRVHPTPIVTASNNLNLCKGNSTQLLAIGAQTYNWTPIQALSCSNCASPVANPLTTTSYTVKGTNSFGCSAFDTVVVTVIQPIDVQISGNDTICVGQSANLLASGAVTYNWLPSTGLNNATISNPTASPAVTTTYQVIGKDGFNCFSDTAYVTVAVGQYPIVSLGPDQTLSTGTLLPLATTITNGPIQTWVWTPPTDLSCNNCALPVATIKNNISYTVKVTTYYGCSASDTIRIQTFCESAQVFVPNAFTPDGDGVNDVLMVRGKGIAMVKTFRIFNRWGEVVFEKSAFQPNNPAYGWDGKIKGVQGPPDVFVYMAEVVCENGSTYTYKGNVTILK
jgi:gliding motility-associated-like protein